ncbi:MAG TPA: asparagine synthase (glutamine-hydrolyzing) [Nitrospira sp.]|nr:asparagine synthase (glutamine-hydrolyzing) [Nitrospira sp.]
MCGVAGIFAYRDQAPPVDQEELLRIREAMRSRGPDGEGLWLSRHGRVGLAHRRLAIIDLTDDGLQPMATPDGALHISFNGEIYNYRELRRLLESKGYVFRTNSDTEVLLYLYRAFGMTMLEHLRGMYAFALWDQASQSLVLARDPMGIKPLYYADDGATIRVASQVKALLAGDRVDRSPQPAGHVGFLLWGYVPEPHTLYRGVKSLPAGSVMRIERNTSPHLRTIFSISRLFERAEQENREASQMRTGVDRLDVLRSALLDSVRHHLVSDVPVGVFLSSGIDSSVIASLAQEAGQPVSAVTLGFQEYAGTESDEVPLAQALSRQLGMTHHIEWIQKDEFLNEVPSILAAMDQPSIDGVNTYFVARAASRLGFKVALTGMGGDELFAGYRHFKQLPRTVACVKWPSNIPFFGSTIRKLSTPVIKRIISPKYAGLFEYGGSLPGAYLLRRGTFMPWELPEHLDDDLISEGWADLHQMDRLQASQDQIHQMRAKITALEFDWYLRNQLLRDTDWASMAHSLEVRTPLVDWTLLDNLAPLLLSSQPPSKREFASIPRMPLPTAIRARRKTGFVVPVRQWIHERMGASESGSRSWARQLYRSLSNAKRALVLLTDAYGGRGGIAKFNRDLLEALSSHPQYRQIVTLPRVVSETVAGAIPEKIQFEFSAANGKLAYAARLFRLLYGSKRFDAVICGHINLLPLAWVASRRAGAPLILICHGIEAWKPTSRWIVNRLASTIDYLISVSAVTRDRFRQWVKPSWRTDFILPNCVDLTCFQPRARKTELLDRYQLYGRTLIMTLVRFSGRERYKGVDEVIEVLPNLLQSFPDLVYMAAGSGEDLPRLQRKAEAMGLSDRVFFPGQISEAEKVDYYNLADAFVMPGQGEGFGIVYLEAMACGVPVVGSVLDGSREALQDGRLGVLVNPRDLASVEAGIRQALGRVHGVPSGLEHFTKRRFQERVQAILNRVAVGPLAETSTS